MEAVPVLSMRALDAPAFARAIGESFRAFGFAMVVGVLVGTYSTVYIASPFVIWWQGLKERRVPAARAAL